MTGLEHALWDHCKSYPVNDVIKGVTESETITLRKLAVEIGGWIVWDGSDGERFVTFKEWWAMQPITKPKPTKEQERLLDDIISYMRDEMFPPKHLQAIGIITCFANYSAESEAEVFEFAQKLLQKYN